MTETEAHLFFQSRTALSPDFLDFRNMLDEETDFVRACHPHVPEFKARDRAAENLIAWCLEGPATNFGKTMTALAAFVASHRRPAIWAALIGYKKFQRNPSDVSDPSDRSDPSDQSKTIKGDQS